MAPIQDVGYHVSRRTVAGVAIMDSRRAVSSLRVSVAAVAFGCCAVALAATVRRSIPECPDDGCAAVRCPSGRDACLLGLVPDGCGCSPYGVCGLGESHECNESGQPCAGHLNCIRMEDDGDGTTDSVAVYRCACKKKEPACGSNNRTYSNVCQLNESAAKLGNDRSLWIQHSGPCQSVPIIRSVPKTLAGTVGHPVVLDCEINGYPVPSINWQFTDINGITKSLPGDDSLIAVQTRGGPDKFTVTSWVQIIEFKPTHAGNYTCMGKNSVDTTTSSAILHIRKITEN